MMKPRLQEIESGDKSHALQNRNRLRESKKEGLKKGVNIAQGTRKFE